MTTPSAEWYIRAGTKRVEGWLTPESARLIQVASNTQLADGITGSVGEIGIHHGKLFILLYLLAQPSERAFAIDVFESQHLNVDRSGKGDRAVFERNLRAVGADLSRIDIVADSSLNISSERLANLSGGVRLFSIDGGHTTRIALNDLALAQAALVKGGIVIVDDVFHPLYPGVSAAFARFMLGQGSLVPFAVSSEKVLLTQPETHDRFLDAVRVGMGDLFVRSEDFYGHQVAIIRSQPTTRERIQVGLSTSGAYRRVRSTPFGKRAVAVVRPTLVRILGR